MNRLNDRQLLPKSPLVETRNRVFCANSTFPLTTPYGVGRSRFLTAEAMFLLCFQTRRSSQDISL